VGLATGGAIAIARQATSARRWTATVAGAAGRGYGHFTVSTIMAPRARRHAGGSGERALRRELLGVPTRTLFGSLPTRGNSTGAKCCVSRNLAVAAALGAAFGHRGGILFGRARWRCLLEAVNYIEHYGLVRRMLADGRYERPAARHAWDAYEWLSNCFLVHLQRHADHHLNPMRPYAALQPQEESPKLPMGYPGMVPLAFLPPLWFAV
jgi:hypothetical protein